MKSTVNEITHNKQRALTRERLKELYKKLGATAFYTVAPSIIKSLSFILLQTSCCAQAYKHL